MFGRAFAKTKPSRSPGSTVTLDSYAEVLLRTGGRLQQRIEHECPYRLGEQQLDQDLSSLDPLDKRKWTANPNYRGHKKFFLAENMTELAQDLRKKEEELKAGGSEGAKLLENLMLDEHYKSSTDIENLRNLLSNMPYTNPIKRFSMDEILCSEYMVGLLKKSMFRFDMKKGGIGGVGG